MYAIRIRNTRTGKCSMLTPNGFTIPTLKDARRVKREVERMWAEHAEIGGMNLHKRWTVEIMRQTTTIIK